MHQKYFHNIRTVEELRRAGISKYQQAKLIKDGQLIKTDVGIYTTKEFADSLTVYEKPFARIVSSAKSSKAPIISHVSAALWYGVPLISTPEKVHLTVRNDMSHRKPNVALHRMSSLQPDDVQMLHGLQVTSPDRTLSDCVATLPMLEASNICNYFLTHELLSFNRTHEILDAPRRRGKHNARLIAQRMNIQCESPLETIVLHAFYDWNLEIPHQQIWLDCGNGKRYRVDFVWPALKIIVEADGMMKYSGQYGDPAEIISLERARQRDLERLGWRFVRVDWKQMHQDPESLRESLLRLGVPTAHNVHL